MVPGASLFLQAVQDIRVGGAAVERAVSIHLAGLDAGGAQ